MGLDERLFGWLHRTLRRARTPAPSSAAVELGALERRLHALACTLAGRPVELREAEGAGGAGGDTLWLPRAFAFAPTRADNALAYVYRVAYGVTQLDRPCAPPAGDDEAAALAALLAVPGTTAALEAAWPGACALRAHLAPFLCVPALAAGERAAAVHGLTARLLGQPVDGALSRPAAAWVESALAAAVAQSNAAARDLLAAWQRLPGRSRRADMPPLLLWGMPMAGRGGARADVGPLDADALPSGSERQGKARERVVDVDPRPPADESPLVHVFEKVLTAEEYQGGSKNLDGEDEMAEHGDALDQLDLRQLVRTRQRARSLLRADVQLDGGGLDVRDPAPDRDAVFYDEWDERRQAYRARWCAVRVRDAAAGGQSSHAAAAGARRRLGREIRALRAQLLRFDRARAPQPRQRDGQEVDIDAVVDNLAAVAGARAGRGCAGDPRLYVARRRRVRDVAVLLLLDASLSTDAWVDGRRVLDIARDAVFIAGEAFADVAIRIGVAAFHSNTRRDCDFTVVKAFDEPWRGAASRLFSLRPQGYTRIGPALRHGAAWLATTRARRRLLVLLSDGKPMDYDRYEGRYGIADVRQALREMRGRAVQPLALAIDAESKRYLPGMFGRSGYVILPRAELLPLRLAKLLQTVR